MKKIYTFLGIALLATSLMTACGDKEEVTAENSRMADNPMADGTYRITKGDTTWDAVTIAAYDFSNDGYITLDCYSADSTIQVHGWVRCDTGDFDYITSKGDYMVYRDKNDTYENNGSNIYNFYPNTATWTESITAIDLTAMTLSGSWSEQATTFEEALNAYNNEIQVVDFSACNMFTLAGTMQNIHWDAWSNVTKASAAKVKFTYDVVK